MAGAEAAADALRTPAASGGCTDGGGLGAHLFTVAGSANARLIRERNAEILGLRIFNQAAGDDVPDASSRPG